MKLITNNPRKIVALEGFGLEVVDRVPIVINPNPHNRQYLEAKKEKCGHLLEELQGEKCPLEFDEEI